MTPAVFTIPAHRSFADALAAGLIARFGKEEMGLARGLVLVPNNRAARTIQDAFVRRSGGGLLLPRLVPIGDPELDERIGGALEPMADGEAIPPAIEPMARRMLLARLVQRHRGVDAAEALRLAAELGRTLDQLLVEEIAPARLAAFAQESESLSAHWQVSLEQLQLILRDWPAELAKRGRIDLTTRRNNLLDAVAKRWRETPPAGLVCAAGITTAAPAVARLLRVVAQAPNGMVVLPGADLAMPDKEWNALGPHTPDPDSGLTKRAIETHPQFHLKLLLDKLSVGRAEVASWRWGGGRDAPAARSRAVANAMAPPLFTGKWQMLQPRERRLSGVRALELTDPAEEAQAIALALREALETPGRTAALVTPDRMLARRVSAHLKRWEIAADDSAGRPLSETASGGLILALAAAGAERFAPVALLTLLKQPLVRTGEERLAWLDGARALDLALRGPRPPAGLDGVTARLEEPSEREGRIRAAALPWWRNVVPLLRPLEAAFEANQSPGFPEPVEGLSFFEAGEGRASTSSAKPAFGLAPLLAAVREAASTLSGEQVWAGAAGRAASDLFARVEGAAGEGPERVEASALLALLEGLLAEEAVRPPYGQHPRLFIWGLLEARLQQADLLILGGLNEGFWPALPAPDPWLAPKLRAELGLPLLERRIGLAAHDFVGALGAPQVLVTRARRDASSPAIASRFWLRLQAMTGGVSTAPRLRHWARAIDRAAGHHPARRPAPSPDKRPLKLSVTEVDRLKADPFAFYARKILGLGQLDAVDADPTAAWRGTAVHAVLEAWMKEDDCDPARLKPRAEAFLAGPDVHPLIRALWQPRLMEAIAFVARRMAEDSDGGRRPLRAEASGAIELAGVRLSGKADRIDRLADGSLAIVDYKTGQPPSNKAVAEGFAMQLGLLGLIAERGGFDGIDGAAAAFEYWSLAKKGGEFGFVASPVGGRSGVEPDEFTERAERQFIGAAEKWLTGAEPFTAKLKPEYSWPEYDQLMRLDEWYGRGVKNPPLLLQGRGTA